MSTNSNSSQMSKIITFVILFGGLIGLYYLYQYLFGPKTGNSYTLLSSKQSAIIDKSKPITITSNQLPGLFDGGEFTVSTWIYVNKWSHRSGFNKSILTIGGSASFDTIRIYLGAFKPTLHVRLHTRESGTTSSTMTGNAADTMNTESLDAATRNATFNVIQTNSGLLSGTSLCDLPEVDLQRWVNITVAVNGRTVDVYLDGKLSRSCVLPSNFKVSPSGYSAYLLGYGGFGGMISTTTMYDAALNPERVYQSYMAGPEPITSIGDWFARFFAPGVSITVSTS